MARLDPAIYHLDVGLRRARWHLTYLTDDIVGVSAFGDGHPDDSDNQTYGATSGRCRRAAVGLVAAMSVLLASATAASAQDSSGDDSPPTTLGPDETSVADAPVLPIVFPVDGEHQFINDWHFPRDGGARLHEGVDIIAERHSSLVATINGVIETVRHSNTGRAGNMVVLRGDDGHRYYYIHLNNDEPGTDNDVNLFEHAFAAGIAEGVRVQAGDPIGFVGDSGNAEHTVPHVHFAVHDAGGESINPYWSLRRADRLGQTSVLGLAQLPVTGPRGGIYVGLGISFLLIGAYFVGASTLLSRLYPEG